jgi:hypothetical protein
MMAAATSGALAGSKKFIRAFMALHLIRETLSRVTAASGVLFTEQRMRGTSSP